MTEKRCSKHVWRWLFARLPDGAALPASLTAAALGHALSHHGEMTVCAICGRLGSRRRGYSRGGGHAVKPIWCDEEREAEYKAEATDWNERLRAAMQDAPAGD